MSQESGNQEEKDQVIADAVNLRDDMEDNGEMRDGAEQTLRLVIAALAAGVPLSYITIILLGHSLTP